MPTPRVRGVLQYARRLMHVSTVSVDVSLHSWALQFA